MFDRECRWPYLRIFRLSLVIAIAFAFAACSSTSSYIAKGEEYLVKRKFQDALMQFRSAADADPSSAAAFWGLARANENLGQFNDTLEALRKTTELDPTNLEAKARLGNYFLLMEPPMISETEQIRDEIVTAAPSMMEGHLLSATILAANGAAEPDVVRAVNKAIETDPSRIEPYVSLARMYVTRGRPAEAEAALKRGIAANPAATGGYLEYGRFLTYAARDAEAEAQFKKGVEVDAAKIESREALASFYVTSRQFDKAEAQYQELVDIQERSPESRLVLAEFYGRTERSDDAARVLNEIVAESPEYVLARYRLGELYLSRRDADKVRQQLDALFAINENDTEALLLRAKIETQSGRIEAAAKDIEQVLRKYPSSREALYLMAEARLSLGELDQATPFIADLERFHPTYLKAKLLRIRAASAAGDTSGILKLANELIKAANAAVPSADNSPQAIADLRLQGVAARGMAQLELRRLPEAKWDLEEVARLSPRSSSAVVNLARLAIAEAKPDAALAFYEKAINIDPQNFDAVSGMVSTCIRTGDTARAHSRLAEMLTKNVRTATEVAALRYLNSTVFSAEKNATAAENELKSSLEVDADYLPAYSAYAGLLVEQKRIDEAIAQYRAVIEKRPTAQIYTMIGILEEARGSRNEAEKAYRSALELTPDLAIAANNLAWLLADQQGNLDEALQLANAVVDRNQTVAGYLDTLGWVYFRKGLASPAVEQLKKAVALDEAVAKKLGEAPNPAFRMRLGLALAKAGDRDNARREVETSLRQSDLLTEREIAEARTILASL